MPEEAGLLRLLVLVSGDLWAGAAVQVFNCLRSLAETGCCELLVGTLNEGELTTRLRESGIEVRVIPEAKLGGHRILFRLRQLLYDHRPHLVHVHEYKLQVLVTAAVMSTTNRIPIVRTIHSRAPRTGDHPHRARLYAWLDELCLRHFTRAVIAVSKELRDHLRATIPDTPLSLIHNALHAHPRTHGSCRAIREAFHIPTEVCWIGTAMRLEPVKNPMALVGLAQALRSAGANFVLSVFGAGSLQDLVMAETQRLELQDCLRFHGHHSDVIDIMSCWDVFVLPSLHEGLPMSLLEAMAAGVPPVCTAVGGVPEVVANGSTGILVPGDDVVQLTHAVLRLIEDPTLRQSLGEHARRHVVKEFSGAAMARQHLEVYRSCLVARRRV